MAVALSARSTGTDQQLPVVCVLCIQVWYCKGLRFDGGVCDNNCS